MRGEPEEESILGLGACWDMLVRSFAIVCSVRASTFDLKTASVRIGFQRDT